MALRESDVGKFGIQKGHIKGVGIFSLDTASPCTGDDCPISKMCSYEHRGYCTLEQKWIKAAFHPYVELLDRVPSKLLAQIIGTQIMPLFRHLIILHKRQMAMSDDELIEVAQKTGQKKVNPLFKEIRETSVTIMSLMRSAGILNLAEQAGLMDVLSGGPPKPEPTGDREDDEAFNMTYGDPGHLDAIIGVD
jgi:hypothetical protein